jgi:thiazole synthase
MNQEPLNDDLYIAGRPFQSRLILGVTDFEPNIMPDVCKASGCEIITHTLTSESDLANTEHTHLDVLDKNLLYIPNTHGCKTAEEAITVANAIRNAGISDWIKLEVSPSTKHYMSDAIETLKAAEALVKQGFTVLPYIHADPVLAKRLEEVGCATVMPLGAPIGTGIGVKARDFIQLIIEEVDVPVVVDAGIGAPSHAAEAMEMGVDAVIVHTAVLYSKNPILQAQSFRAAVWAGRASYLAEPYYHKNKH